MVRIDSAAVSFISRTASTGSWATSCVFAQERGSLNVVTGAAVDTFGGKGQDNARAFDGYAYAFMARRRPEGPPGHGCR